MDIYTHTECVYLLLVLLLWRTLTDTLDLGKLGLGLGYEERGAIPAPDGAKPGDQGARLVEGPDRLLSPLT